MRIRRSIAALVVTTFAVVGADISSASAAVPATDAAKWTPAQVVSSVVLRTSDFESITAKADPDATSLDVLSLGHNCGYAFSSDRHRVARRQVWLYNEKKEDLDIASEAVAYQSTAWAVKALNEWRTSVSRCKSGRYYPSDDPEIVAIATTVIDSGAEPGFPIANNVVTVERKTLQKDAYTVYEVTVLQQHKNVVSETYWYLDSAPTAKELSAIETFASWSGKRLAAV